MQVRGRMSGMLYDAYPDTYRRGEWWVRSQSGYKSRFDSKEAVLRVYDEVYPDDIPMANQINPVFPNTAKDREDIPLAEGLFYYFPNALAMVARVSVAGNKQHNLGPLHWDRSVSTNHADKILRHQVDAGTSDSDNMPHSAKVAWRALAQLEDELIAAGATPGRNARNSPGNKKEGEGIERNENTVVKSGLSCCEENVLPTTGREQR